MTGLNYSMIKFQTEPVKYLVLSGGGAKGIGYSGVYEALSIAGTMEATEGIAGSSAGALSAAFIATGMDPKAFQDLMQATNLRELLGDKGIGLLNKDGAPLYELLDKTIRANIRDFLNSHDIKSLIETRISVLDKEQNQIREDLANAIASNATLGKEIHNLAHQMTFQQDKYDIIAIQKQITTFTSEAAEAVKNIERLTYKNAELGNDRIKVESLTKGEYKSLEDLKHKCTDEANKILFKDLALMRLLAPDKFKDLYVTAVRRDNGELKIFNALDTPEVDIAMACRASAAIPLVFRPITIDGAQYVDGGYRDNTPYNHFKDSEIKSAVKDITDDSHEIVESQKKGRTLAFVFSDDNSKLALYSAQENFYKPSTIKKFIADICVKVLAKVGGKFKYTQALSTTYNNMRENTVQTIPLATKGVGTLSFHKAQKKRKHLHTSGYIQTIDYLNQHKLGKKEDRHIKYEAFFLEVYDKVDSNKLHGLWEHKVKTEPDDKKANLLEFCTPQKWKDKNTLESKDKVIEEYILLASTSRTNGKLTPNTTTIESLLSTLNDKTTLDKIKQNFVRILDKPVEEGKEKHFSKKDIEKFIEKMMDKQNVRGKESPISKQYVKRIKSSDVTPEKER